jgi:hypothetical protein
MSLPNLIFACFFLLQQVQVRALENVTGHGLLPDDFLHLEDQNRYCEGNLPISIFGQLELSIIWAAGRILKQWRRLSGSSVMGKWLQLKPPWNFADGGDTGLVMFWKFQWLG